MEKITLTFSNVPILVFQDNRLMHKLPAEYEDLKKQWKLGQLVPPLRAMAQKAVLDFLAKLTERDVTVISEHLQKTVTIERLDYKLVHNYVTKIDEAEELLNRLQLTGRIFLHRDGDLLYVCSWR